jgi:hypothetical protein
MGYLIMVVDQLEFNDIQSKCKPNCHNTFGMKAHQKFV